MWASHPRVLLARAILLDWLGQLMILSSIMFTPVWFGFSTDITLRLEDQTTWLIISLLLYPLLGWLFGSYTLLRWRHLPLSLLLQRLLITVISTFIVGSMISFLFNPPPEVWIVARQVQLPWLTALFVWSFLIRLALRRGLLLSNPPRLILLANSDETSEILHDWGRVELVQRLEPLSSSALGQLLDEGVFPLLVALSPSLRRDSMFSGLIERLELQDPRVVQTISVISLFEQQQERLPPSLLDNASVLYEDLPWAAPFSFQGQLKRLADLTLAAALLFITAPFVGLAAFLIWLEDRGPVFYRQRRSGWLGRPFTVHKLRTMTHQSSSGMSLWTQPGDQRITAIGRLLRRTRLDELPQLLNVLNGDMSLIGPRPERPELENELCKHIPHYRKRYWMRPA